MMSDVQNVCIQTDSPVKEVAENVTMKIGGRLVDWIVQLDPGIY